MSATRNNSAWEMIDRYLDEERRRIQDEIRNYPAPIPACDAQFNYLLEAREALSSELARVREQMKEDMDSEDARRSIDAFLSHSTCLGSSEKKDIRAFIENEHC